MERGTKIVLENTIKRLEQSILEYNPNAFDFKYEYKIIDNLIFMIGHSKIVNNYDSIKIEWGIYRMICIDIYNGVIYEDGNVIDHDKMYDVNTVIKKTKGYFNHYLKKLNNLKDE